MSAGAPARHRAPRHGAHPPLPGPPPGASPPYGPPPRRTRRLSRRARVVLCGLLVLPLLAGLAVYLTRGSVPAPAVRDGSARGRPAGILAVRPVGRRIHRVLRRAALPRRRRQRARLAVAETIGRPDQAPPRHAVTVRIRQPTAPSSTAPTSTASATSPAGTSSGSAAAQVLALINQARSAAGLAPLTITTGLNSSASAHNSRMAGGCGLSHQCPGEPDLGARETAAGVHWTAAGENIGEGGPVANTTAAMAQMAVGLTQAMLNEKPPDDGHRRNILSSSFTHIGIAVFRDSSGTVWLTQDFSN